MDSWNSKWSWPSMNRDSGAFYALTILKNNLNVPLDLATTLNSLVEFDPAANSAFNCALRKTNN